MMACGMVEARQERYRFIRELGRGAMGSVRLVHDSVRGHAVAQKHLANAQAAATLHFKREFRVLSRLSHPNLVRVHELGDDAEGLYFVMEQIDGQPIDVFCRERGVYPSLEHLLPQIVDALVFIHAHGVVHRDLKPSNVLVTKAGVVKLLDFGVLGDFAGQRIADERIVVGTPGYMAPEQIRGEPPQTASDLYALGCLLFEILAGRPVFEGSRSTVLQAHLAEAPPELGTLAPSVPPLYAAICRDLLQKDPARRPRAESLPFARARPPRVLGDLVGRDELFAGLRQQLSGTQILALVGPSGIGKTALVESLTRELEREGRLVLRAKVRPSERVAYNALDGAVDDLAHTLGRRSGDDGAVRASAEVARRVFPVLAASGFPTSERTKESVRFRLFGARREHTRADMFGALHRLMLHAAEPDPRVVIAIDDFQWADQDSLALLSFLVEATDSPPTVVLSLRDDVGSSPASEWLEAQPGVVREVVPPLSSSAISTIIQLAASASGHELAGADAARAAESCQGRPFLAEVAGRALATTGTPDLEGLIRRDNSLERSLLGLLVAADAWTPGPLLAKISEASLGELDDAISVLAQDGLVRRGRQGGIDGVIDLYHDGVRRAVSATLPDVVERAHAHLADHWLAIADAPPERVVRHLLGAGRRPEAARAARSAAIRAEDQRAFGLAADMYEVALIDPGADAETLLEARAQALEKVGRHRDAARVWSELGASAPAERKLDFAVSEAHSLIAGNEVELGLDRLDGALAEVGDPASHTRSPQAMLSVGTFVLGPPGRHVRRVLSLRRRARADVTSAERDVKIGILLCFLDPLSGIRYLLRARDRFAEAGARAQEAECDYMFAVLAMIGSRHADVPLAKRYLRRAEAILGTGVRPPDAVAMAEYVAGLRALRVGRWSEAREILDRAAISFEKSGRVTERLMCASYSTMTDVYRQDAPAIRARLAWFRQNLQELGGGIITAHVELIEGYLLHLEGKIEDSWDAVTRIVKMYSGRRPNAQRAGALMYRHMVDAYRERPAAHAEFLSAMKAVSGYAFFDTMFAGPFAMIGGLLEAHAIRRGARTGKKSRLEWFARRVETSPPLVAGSSDRARAYAERAPERALVFLERAEDTARRYDRRVDVAIASFQRGLRLGGSAGQALCHSARDALKKAGLGEAILHEDPAFA
jgi:hypothetical protein